MSYIIAGLALINGLALVADIAGKRIMSDLSNVKSSTRNANVPTIVTPIPAPSVTPEKVTIQQPASYYEAMQQGIKDAVGVEEKPAEIPFRRNGLDH